MGSAPGHARTSGLARKTALRKRPVHVNVQSRCVWADSSWASRHSVNRPLLNCPNFLFTRPSSRRLLRARACCRVPLHILIKFVFAALAAKRCVCLQRTNSFRQVNATGGRPSESPTQTTQQITNPDAANRGRSTKLRNSTQRTCGKSHGLSQNVAKQRLLPYGTIVALVRMTCFRNEHHVCGQ